MKIVHYPHPALRWKSKPIVEIDSNLDAIVKQMFELMYEARGIGLAANQVALPYRLFVLNIGEEKDPEQEHVFINPEITRRKGIAEGEEGCLSLPQLYGPVRRAAEITVEAYDLNGELFEMDLDDLAARAVQHECDHLDGIMFTDRMTDPARREIQEKIDQFEQAFRQGQAAGDIPSDDVLKRELAAMEPRVQA